LAVLTYIYSATKNIRYLISEKIKNYFRAEIVLVKIANISTAKILTRSKHGPQIGYLKNRCLPETKLYEYTVDDNAADGANTGRSASTAPPPEKVPDDSIRVPLLPRSGDTNVFFAASVSFQIKSNRTIK
jgi:hypothetical protein